MNWKETFLFKLTGEGANQLPQIKGGARGEKFPGQCRGSAISLKEKGAEERGAHPRLLTERSPSRLEGWPYLSKDGVSGETIAGRRGKAVFTSKSSEPGIRGEEKRAPSCKKKGTKSQPGGETSHGGHFHRGPGRMGNPLHGGFRGRAGGENAAPTNGPCVKRNVYPKGKMLGTYLSVLGKGVSLVWGKIRKNRTLLSLKNTDSGAQGGSVRVILINAPDDSGKSTSKA